MLENCLKHKIIRDFLKNYSQEKWPIIIPSLIEIAILNLKSSFKTLFFSEEDFKNILSDLKENLNLGNPFITQKEKIRKKPSTDWRNGKQTCYEDYEIICRDNIKKTLYDEPYDFYGKNNYMIFMVKIIIIIILIVIIIIVIIILIIGIIIIIIIKIKV